LHADQEVVLVLNEEDEDVLTETVFVGFHIVLRVGDDSGLEDRGEILGGHLIQIGLCGEDGKKIEDVEEQLTVEWWELSDKFLIALDCGIQVKSASRWTLSFHLAHSLRLVSAEGLAKLIVKV
jgi:hypothetical protein